MLSLSLMANALLLPTARSPGPAPLTRRGAMQAAGAAAATFAFVHGAEAEENFSRMGGLLEPFIDTQKGYKLYVPSGWNKFDADPGVYDVKYQDIIEQETTVQVSSSPVQTATSVSALGELQEVGEKFAKSRSAKLVGATQKDVDGTLFYTLELEGEQYHELLGLCINKGKLFRVTAVTSNKKWPKRKELYRNVLASFVPKGY